MQPIVEETFEHALAELLRRTESVSGVGARTGDALESLIVQYPQFEQELREFWQMHCHFVFAGEQAAQAPSLIAGANAQPAGQAGDSSGLQSTGDLIGRSLGPYELIEEIDRGGMGVVFKARHAQLERVVALKIIRSGELAGPGELKRFRSEAEAASQLSHPNIIPIYEVGQVGGLVYFTMPYIEGQTLLKRMSDQPLEVDEAVRLVYRLCHAIQYAHRQGILHRDLKPGNVIIDNQGQPVIIDFGLAKFAARDSDLTATGQILGTPAYMAPEQASGRGNKAESSADIYSLGAILYFLLSGQPPFNGPTAFDILLQVMDREPPAPSKLNRKVSRDLDYICSRAMAKKTEKRYASAVELAADLERFLKHEPLELPHYSLSNRLARWWRRSPILVSHVCGIGTAAAITLPAHLAHVSNSRTSYQLILLGCWLAACFALQWLVFRARYRDIGCLAWATVDVILSTWLITNAESPRTLLLIGYPMMIAASALFYRTRFVIYMTLICVIGFLFLKLFTDDPSLARIDFSAIFVSGLLVIGLTMHSMIQRLRGMSQFYEG